MKRHLASSEEWRSITAETLEQLGVAAWEWDIESGDVWWSDNFGPLVGRPRGFSPSRIEDAFGLFHPDDPQPGSFEEMLESVRDGEVETQRRALLPDGTVRWTSHRYFLVTGEDGRPLRLCGVVTDNHAAKRREEEAAFLAAAGKVLARSLDPAETLRQLASLTVPRLADWCMVHLSAEAGLELVHVAHPDEDRRRRLEELATEYPPDPTIEVGVARVAATGEPVLIETVSDELMRIMARDERHLDMLHREALTSLMMVPIRLDGVTFGVVALATAESKIRFSQADLSFAEEVIGRAAEATRSALLHSRLTETANRLVRLHRVTAKLSAATTEHDAVTTALGEILAATGASRGTLVLRSPDSGEMLLAASEGYPEDVVRSWSPELNEKRPTPIAEAVASGRGVFLPSLEALNRRFPDLENWGTVPVGKAWAAVPIRGRDTIIGAIGLSFEEPQDFSREVIAFVESVADQCGVVLERARQFDQQVSIAETLQRAVVPEVMPSVTGVTASAQYHPGGEGQVGGDWFDLFSTTAGNVVAVVGDVVGRGMPAVATMIQLRNALRAYMVEGQAPGEALMAMNRFMHTAIEKQYRFATTMVARYEPAAARLRLAVAGHLPPVYRAASGVTVVVDTITGPPLGPTPDPTYDETTIESVGPGAILATVSDGWIERREHDLDKQIENMRAVVELGPADAHGVLAALETAFVTGTPVNDDATALVLRME